MGPDHQKMLGDAGLCQTVENFHNDLGCPADKERAIHPLLAHQRRLEVADTFAGRRLASDELGMDRFQIRRARTETLLGAGRRRADQIVSSVDGLPDHAATNFASVFRRSFEFLKDGARVDVLSAGVIADVGEIHGFPSKHAFLQYTWKTPDYQ